MGSVERHSCTMKTSILLGVFCILLSQLDFGEGRATEAVTRSPRPRSEDVEAAEATDTGSVQDVEEDSYEDSDEDSGEDSDEDSSEESNESSSSSSSEESKENSSSSSSSESDESDSDESNSDESNSDESDSVESNSNESKESSDEILKYKYKLLSPRSGIWTRNGVELKFPENPIVLHSNHIKK